jgi:hypothetical protein
MHFLSLAPYSLLKKEKEKKEREKKGKREEKAQNFCCLSRRQLVNRSGAAGARRLLIVRSGRGGQHPQLHSSGDATGQKAVHNKEHHGKGMHTLPQ